MKDCLLKMSLIILLMIIGARYADAGIAHSTTDGGLWNDEKTWIEGFVPGPADTAIIQGNVIVGNVINNVIYDSYGGWIIVEQNGTLVAHDYGGGLITLKLFVAHDITNNGTIHNGTEYLQLLISGDIVNNNIWQPYETVLTGNTNQNISLGEGSIFGGFWTNDNSDSLTALSDIRYDGRYVYSGIDYTGDFNLKGNTLFMDGFSINTTGTIIYNGTIEGNFEILGTFDVNKYVTDTMRFVGQVTVSDTLQNTIYGGGSGIQKLLIDGDIINNGVVQDNPFGDELNIIITGNIINNNLWTCNYVNLVGTGTQHIAQSPGTKFVSNFYDLDSSSMLLGDSDIELAMDFDLKGSTLDMQNHTLRMGGWLINGYINNTILHGGSLKNITSLDNLTIEGTVSIDDFNIFHGSVVVTDTLQSSYYGGGVYNFDLTIDGSLTNNGVIKNQIPGLWLRIFINGNMTNNGIWNNFLTYVYVSNEQYIELMDDKPIESAVMFEAAIGSEPYQWYYEDKILDSQDFEGETEKVLTWNVPVSPDWYGTFSCETGSKKTMKIIIKKGITGIHEDQACKARIWSYDNYVYIDLPEGEHGEASVYDIIGRKVAGFNISGGVTREYLNMSGYFIVQIKVNNKVASQKVFVR